MRSRTPDARCRRSAPGEVHCFGLTIDRRGRAWLPHLFGPGHYAVFSRPDALPSVLPRLYARITGLGG